VVAATPHVEPLGLTARETEIVRLVAAGLSNSAIATALVLSTRTVERIATLISMTGDLNFV
jgi:DNA-binding NarL/FixJ family response regulator